jgi:hypothetical protein
MISRSEEFSEIVNHLDFVILAVFAQNIDHPIEILSYSIERIKKLPDSKILAKIGYMQIYLEIMGS